MSLPGSSTKNCALCLIHSMRHPAPWRAHTTLLYILTLYMTLAFIYPSLKPPKTLLIGWQHL
ncbi:hypothetical protein JVU11DRAFT_2515 [Chiua virens]|nr:hypothetical protein JVU11DRAFT_2515 [Chiua virens]